jgi:hypothetical protein
VLNSKDNVLSNRTAFGNVTVSWNGLAIS